MKIDIPNITDDPIYKEMRVNTMLATKQFLIHLEEDRPRGTPFLAYALDVIDADIKKHGGEELNKKIGKMIAEGKKKRKKKV